MAFTTPSLVSCNKPRLWAHHRLRNSAGARNTSHIPGDGKSGHPLDLRHITASSSQPIDTMWSKRHVFKLIGRKLVLYTYGGVSERSKCPGAILRNGRPEAAVSPTCNAPPDSPPGLRQAYRYFAPPNRRGFWLSRWASVERAVLEFQNSRARAPATWHYARTPSAPKEARSE